MRPGIPFLHVPKCPGCAGTGFEVVDRETIDCRACGGSGIAPKSPPAPRPTVRYLHWWCHRCATRVRIETAESADDDKRGVWADVGEVECPVCCSPMRDWDELVARGEVPLNNGDWETFEAWRKR